MALVAAQQNARPEARVFRVEDLVRHAREGRIRVPPFQRAFKWGRADVEKLFDSIWRGFPIGTLLLWARRGPAGPIRLGDLTFDVQEQLQSWHVVDGQQRIVSLVSTLLSGVRRGEQFELYFDLVNGIVTHVSRDTPPAAYLPLAAVVDSEELHEWADDHRMELTSDHVKLAFRVGKLIREYEIPAYVIDTADEQIVREVFERINSSGKPLLASEVFDALHAPLDREPSARLSDVVDRLRARSLGELEEDHVLRSLLVIEGKDPTGDLRKQLAEVDVTSAIVRVERALDRVLGFLAGDAGIPHLRLLPYRIPLAVLSAYFDRFPRPSERARRLLVRWLWRGAATAEMRGGGGMRPAIAAVRASLHEEHAAAGVLATVSSFRPGPPASEDFNLRYARSRIIGIAMAELRPHHLVTGQALDVVELLDTERAFAQLVSHKPEGLAPEDATVFSSVGNRLLHPPLGTSFLSAIETMPSPHVLASHGIEADAIGALGGDNRLAFLELRRRRLEALAEDLVERRAEWHHSDRPSIEAMSDEEE